MKMIIILFFIVISSCSIDTSYDRETYDYKEVEKEIILTEISSSLIETKEYSFEGNKIIQKDYLIENPSTGSRWDVSVYSQKEILEDVPAVILVPGGIGSKNSLLKPSGVDKKFSIVEKIVSEGFIVLIFSAEGRGLSEGEIDYNGYDDQDGLYNLYRFLASYENVDEEKLGVVSYSYGVAMASGMLGRFQPEISYYIEWEGPVNRNYVSTGCTDSGAVKEGITCDDEDYWVEREALRFVPYFKVDHLMIVQTEEDHVQEINEHSLEFNNLAIQYLDWVRVNGDGNSINKMYTLETIPVLSEKENYQAVILQAMKEFTE
ncbi:MAG: hypothetical protein Q8R18_02660 [bacterium]|nr:hypothetical protein [bacterium]